MDFLSHSESLLPHLDDEDASHLETIEQQIKLMGRIVDDALDLSKIEAGKMQIESVAFNIKKLCLSLASGYKTKGQTEYHSGFECIKYVQRNVITDVFV